MKQVLRCYFWVPAHQFPSLSSWDLHKCGDLHSWASYCFECAIPSPQTAVKVHSAAIKTQNQITQLCEYLLSYGRKIQKFSMLKAKFRLCFFSNRFYLGLQKAPHAVNRLKKQLEKTAGYIPTWNNLISRQGLHRLFSVRKLLHHWHELWNKLFECVAP